MYSISSAEDGSSADRVDQPRLLPAEPSPAAPGEFHPTGEPSAVAPAGGRGGLLRRRQSGLTGQLQSSSAAASQEYEGTPTPAASPYSPSGQPATLHPSGTAASDETPPQETLNAYVPSSETTDTAPPAEIAGTRSVLKRAASGIGMPAESSSAPASGTMEDTSARRAPAGAPSTNVPGARPRLSASGLGSPANNAGATSLSVRGPSLRVDVNGPAAIAVGTPSTYDFTIANDSETAAQEVQVRIGMPNFATVSSGQASAGEARLQPGAGQSLMVWNLPELGGRQSATLKLDLVASQGQPLDMGIEWSCRPSAAVASITVKQAQLQLQLNGPGDMVFGDEKPFTISVRNPGNGDADNVIVSLVSGRGRPQQIDVGTVGAGQQKDLQVQVLASEAGEMQLRAEATAEGGLAADALGKVIVRKAELNVAVEGPGLKFAGAEAAYAVTIQNTGSAPADDVNLSLALPTGAKYVGGLEGASAAGSAVRWKLPSLPAGMQKTFEVQLQLNAAGVHAIAIQAQAGAGIAASGEAQTTVEATADLKLVVNDPAGPLSTSEEAIYELQVMNRGSEAAGQVKIVMQFGDGIEPLSFEGCEARLVPGQVLCQPLAQLGAGEQVTMRVKAKATKGGSHQFRVEVTSMDATRLVSEGTTRFFAESGNLGAAASTARKPTLAPTPATLR
jgi:hypothetical protein